MITFSSIGCHWHRYHGTPFYLVALEIDGAHGHQSGGHLDASVPQARAVVDDFGNLVCVTGFR